MLLCSVFIYSTVAGRKCEINLFVIVMNRHHHDAKRLAEASRRCDHPPELQSVLRQLCISRSL